MSPWWGGSGGGTPTNDRPTPDSSGDEVVFPLSKADSGFVSTGSRLVRYRKSADQLWNGSFNARIRALLWLPVCVT